MGDKIPVMVRGRVSGYVSREPVEYAEARLMEGADTKTVLNEVKELGFEKEAVRVVAQAMRRVRVRHEAGGEEGKADG